MVDANEFKYKAEEFKGKRDHFKVKAEKELQE